MAHIRRFLLPIRASFCALSPPNPSLFRSRNSRRKMSLGRFLGLSVLTGSSVAYAMDGDDIIAEESQANFWDSSGCLEDDPDTFLAWARKCWLPVILVVTVVTGWQHPLSLAIKIALFLFSTKPSPFSVHLFIEKMRRQSMFQDPGLYKLKLFYAKKVEVEDYKLLCLATVELRDRKLTLIGILGTWWVLQSSNCHGGTSVFGP
ncbi:uncharacterized protein LOC143884488 isoform X2 [Tasmannia lanceolata]|uniref:uncharacterized protein LOC143884488 isoform X2 n=1 Tax=Tasmannia lanceolata TaxID=3420 RepID=UPI004063CF10